MPRGSQQPKFTIENTNFIYRNFEGRVSEFNKEGKKSCAVYIPDPELAKALEADGWNISYTKADEGEAEGLPFINVKVNFSFKPPRILMVTSTGMRQLSRGMVTELDDADVTNVDLECVGNPYNVRGETGVSCYLRTMYVTINESELDKKYGFYNQNFEEDLED